MALSCADFTSEVLEQLESMGIVRIQDVETECMDTTMRATRYALARVDTVLKLAQELVVRLGTESGVSDASQQAAKGLHKAINSMKPKYMVGTHYKSIDDGRTKGKTRWVMDLQAGSLCAVQVRRGRKWDEACEGERGRLAEEIETSQVRSAPQEFGCFNSDVLPRWARTLN